MTKEEIIGTKKQRQVRIGGSEFGTVIDVNPYKKRIELVLEKAGVIENTFEGNEATRRGELLETEIIAKFEDETGIEVKDEQKEFTLEVENCLPLVCHVDGITSNNTVFEAKTTDIKSKTWKDGIPEYYKAQLEFNCMLAGLDTADIVVAFCDGENIEHLEHYTYKICLTKEEIIEHCKKFTNDINKYKELGTINNGKIINAEIDNDLIEELDDINEKLKDFKQAMKPLEDRKKQIESSLKEQIGVNEGIQNDLYKITLSNRITSPTFEYKISRGILKVERV